MNPYYLNESDLRPVLVFGIGDLSELACYWIKRDTPYEVAGFVVDAAYLPAGGSHMGMPVYSSAEIGERLGPDAVRLIVPIGYRRMNQARQEKYEQLKAMGYEFIRYISSQASVWSADAIGENTLIYEHAIVQPFATVGCNVIVRSGAHVSHHCIVEDHAFIAAEVAMGGRSVIGHHAFVGIGAVVADSVAVGSGCFIGAGSVVVKPTEPDFLYVGNPAKRTEKTGMSVTGG